MNTRLTYLLLATALLLPFAHAASINDVGASGACHDTGGFGGQGEVTVHNGQVTASPAQGDPTGIPLAVAAFANDPTTIPSGDGCTSAGDDRVEAHVVTDSTSVQVCYDGNTADLTGPCTMHN
ncbi:MAG: hypothetical protein QOE90_2561 [Thermoplasmata archaeon]|jgi:hypothetical protein|nr:hypothetical protein [Thermoplasmata archaeon]